MPAVRVGYDGQYRTDGRGKQVTNRVADICMVVAVGIVFAGLWTDVAGTVARAGICGRTDRDGRSGKGQLRDVCQDEGHVDDGSRGESRSVDAVVIDVVLGGEGG
jgi:hypothetical protein